ncbi:MAG: helix-turn-helix transcriptional regulator [Oscillospiraceae bacterium]|nr:helix-turn-helix transcriptional regulator [Oscillospiraceae bacterium]
MQNHLYLYPNLVRARKEKCSQAELAEHLGITQQEVSRYERGETKAPVNYLADVAEFCGVSVDYLLGRQTETAAMLTQDESELLHLYQSLSPENRIRLKERAAALREMQSDE